MYLPIPFCCGKTVEVSRLDTAAFLLFGLFSTATSIATPFAFDRFIARPGGDTIFPDLMYATQGRGMDYVRVAVEGSLVISFAGLVIYALHRLVCQVTWLRSAAFFGVAGLYFITVCLLPIFFAVLILEVPDLRRIEGLADSAPLLAMTSPFAVLMFLFNEMGSEFPRTTSLAPFYVIHGLVLGLTIFEIRRRGRGLREMYLPARTAKVN